jgi:hypothetical protein
MFIIASNPPTILKGYARLCLLVAPVVEGLAGGLTTLHGAIYACVSHMSNYHLISNYDHV